MQGHGKLLLVGRFFCVKLRGLKDQSVPCSRSIPVARGSGKNICLLNSGKCQSLLLEVIWGTWMLVHGTGSRASFSFSHLARLGGTSQMVNKSLAPTTGSV